MPPDARRTRKRVATKKRLVRKAARSESREGRRREQLRPATSRSTVCPYNLSVRVRRGFAPHHRSVRVTADQLVVIGDLELEERREFIADAAAVIATAEGDIELDCSQLDALDGSTLGMLVAVARNAQRRGARVVLNLPSVRVRRDLDDAGVSHMFVWLA
jgi:anti-anti-sigma regulatory factor